jgi:hypothetical protein
LANGSSKRPGESPADQPDKKELRMANMSSDAHAGGNCDLSQLLSEFYRSTIDVKKVVFWCP